MITLLEKLQFNRRGQVAVLGDRSGHLLEWPGIKDQLAAHCVNQRAVQMVRRQQPYSQLEPIQLIRALADEIRAEAQQNLWPPLIDLGEALEILEQPPPVRMEGADLVHLAAVAETLDLLRDHFLARRDSCPLWGEAAV